MKVSELKQYKNNLYSSLSRDLSEFEKNFLLISGGILAFSITFIKEIVKIDQANCLNLLFLSWLFIIISIGIMMFTFLKSSIASDKIWSVVDDFIISKKLYEDDILIKIEDVDIIKEKVNEVYYRNKLILKRLRYSAVVSFILGIILLALYVSINLSNENISKSNNATNIGRALKKDSVEIFQNEKLIKLIFNYGNTKTDTTNTKTDTTNTETDTTNAETKSASTTKTDTSSNSNKER